MEAERGQSTVEWMGLLSLVCLLLVGLLTVGVRVPGTALADSIFSKLLCAASMADSCGDEPHLIAAYGTEVGKLARDHMPTIAFERGSRALPVDFRRCRSTVCGDGDDDPEKALVRRTEAGLPVTAFVHVVDCRPAEIERSERAGAECSGDRAGNLYVQYWTYYADSATLRGVPVVGEKGYHADDWESVQIRVGPDGDIDQRASSHHGYNYQQGSANWGSDAGVSPLKALAELIGGRHRNGWGPETRLLVVSGGSHAGGTAGIPRWNRLTRGKQVHLVALEQIAASEEDSPRFAVPPPWHKHVWRDPEAEGTD